MHPAIRKRFAANTECEYPGRARLSASTIGQCIAWICCLLGRPLPVSRGELDACIRLERAQGGMRWIRDYIHPGGKVERVCSTKRIDRKGRLHECARLVSMRLQLSEEGGSLVFTSDAFLLDLGPLHIPIPDILTPGRITVRHEARGKDRFEFHLTCDHPWFGRVFDQSVVCTDPTEN
ncbi:DUF4166 domain-containing protein [Maricaulis sp. MIT060901]|uniref:DUF4166 domain-containing protein n=1 Tax=Maricaulis sp. MIT060901 TaxID=3096993 RepID=UPI0039994C4D